MRSSVHRRGMLAVALVLAACSGRTEGNAAQEETVAQGGAAAAWVTQLGAIANAVQQHPAMADSILAAHDMTRAVFDSLIYQVAADSALTAQFERARSR